MHDWDKLSWHWKQNTTFVKTQPKKKTFKYFNLYMTTYNKNT